MNQCRDCCARITTMVGFLVVWKSWKRRDFSLNFLKFLQFLQISSNSPFSGVSQLRLSLSGTQLTSPRQLSRQLFAAPKKSHQYCTMMLAQWAQFVYADLIQVGSTRLFKGNESLPLPCCAVEHPECMPILTDEDDLTYRSWFFGDF
jgi:hypothetical protein